MAELKHGFIRMVKRHLLGTPRWLGDNQAMLETDRKAAAERLRAAMKTAGISNTVLAEAAGVSVQAVTGWLKTGKIARERIPVVAATVQRSVDWLLTGREPARIREQRAVYEGGVYSGDEQILIEKYRSLSPEDRIRLQKIATALAPEQRARRKRKACGG